MIIASIIIIIHDNNNRHEIASVVIIIIMIIASTIGLSWITITSKAVISAIAIIKITASMIVVGALKINNFNVHFNIF